MPHRNPKASLAILGLVLGITTLLPGCVRRRLMVRSNPPGAMVYVDNQPIGTTPCATDFVYYGTREIRLVKPGYESLTVNQPIPAPWYQLPPLDFVSENIVPRKIQDYRSLSYNLVPQVIVPTEQLIARAEELRRSTLQGAVVPAGATAPVLPASPLVVPPGTPILNSPQPTLAPPANMPNAFAPELVGPGLQAPPASAGTIPRGGQPLEPLPAP